ncbi:MAG: hypothetical protein ACI4WR_08495 [Bulleidia sp.]
MAEKTDDRLDEILKKLDAAEKEFDEKFSHSGLQDLINKQNASEGH